MLLLVHKCTVLALGKHLFAGNSIPTLSLLLLKLIHIHKGVKLFLIIFSRTYVPMYHLFFINHTFDLFPVDLVQNRTN